MPTTTLKLPADLKSRIAPLAADAGVTPHAWMVGALAAQTELAERRQALVRHAAEAAAEVDAGGDVYAADAVHEYLRQRLAGRATKRPAPIRR